MFLVEKEIKKLIKQAYKMSELTLGHMEEEYIISGIYWQVCIDKNKLSNKVKAALVELGATFPGINQTKQYGASFDESMEGVYKQEEMQMWYRIPNAEKNCVISNVSYSKKGKTARVGQMMTGETFSVPESAICMTNRYKDGVIGPIVERDWMWLYDEDMLVKIKPCKVDEEGKLLGTLGNMTLDEEILTV